MAFFVRAIVLVSIIYAAESLVNNTSPLDLLCFALGNPKERSACGNKASTECLLQRAKLPQNINSLSSHPCSTDAVAKVDVKILVDPQTSKCLEKGTKRKYNTVWLATMVKNDAQTLIEWLVWHFLLGVEHALVYDNRSSDNVKEALQPFVDEGLVKYIYFPGIGVQAKAYTDALSRAKKAGIVWLAAIDGDEYITPILDKCIPDFLSRYVGQKTVGGVRLNWQYVNSMGKLWRWENGALDQTILDRTGFYTGRADTHVKTIARVSRTFKFIDAHYAFHTPGVNAISPDNGRKGTYHFTNPPQIKTAVMLHLHVRTLEEWIIKRMRGRGSVKTNQCPYCNATLETLTAEWLCLNGGGFGIPDKDSHQKCKDQAKVPSLIQAPLNWGKPLYGGLAKVMKRQSHLMHAVLKMPIETIPASVLNEKNIAVDIDMSEDSVSVPVSSSVSLEDLAVTDTDTVSVSVSASDARSNSKNSVLGKEMKKASGMGVGEGVGVLMRGRTGEGRTPPDKKEGNVDIHSQHLTTK